MDLEQTAIISPYGSDCLVFIIKVQYKLNH